MRFLSIELFEKPTIFVIIIYNQSKENNNICTSFRKKKITENVIHIDQMK